VVYNLLSDYHLGSFPFWIGTCGLFVLDIFIDKDMHDVSENSFYV
jgi:hypothetical protein